MSKQLKLEKPILFIKDDINIGEIDIKFEFTETDHIEIINREEYNKLISLKNRIDCIENNKLWDKTKKISNDFERVYFPNKKLKGESVSKYEPLSRSYFKLWEIISDFDLINTPENIKVASLAEGPGGFIEAIINYRKKFKYICKKDSIYAITLKSVNNDIPGWNKANYFLKKNPNIKICYGEDGTGNLYNINNILDFVSNTHKNIDLVTADGGFDFSTNFNKQEQTSLKIIFCEIVTALSVQKKGGDFVCKIFDSYTSISVSFLFLLYKHYDVVYITKPFTSRPANSEKYLICKGFKGISEKLLTKLHLVVKLWSSITESNRCIYQIINPLLIPKCFINKINKINSLFFKEQSNNIIKTLSLIDNFSKNIEYEKSDLFIKIMDHQRYIAFNWCKKYKCKVNYDSISLDKMYELNQLNNVINNACDDIKSFNSSVILKNAELTIEPFVKVI